MEKGRSGGICEGRRRGRCYRGNRCCVLIQCIQYHACLHSRLNSDCIRLPYSFRRSLSMLETLRRTTVRPASLYNSKLGRASLDFLLLHQLQRLMEACWSSSLRSKEIQRSYYVAQTQVEQCYYVAQTQVSVLLELCSAVTLACAKLSDDAPWWLVVDVPAEGKQWRGLCFR